MVKKYRTFSYQFKRELVGQIDAGMISQSQAARENDISPSLINRWMNQIHEGGLIEKPTANRMPISTNAGMACLAGRCCTCGKLPESALSSSASCEHVFRKYAGFL